MESRVKLFGHPIHQMLIVFPWGLLATALIFDVVRLIAADGFWSEMSYWMIAAGIISGLVAAPFGGAHLNAPSSLTTRHVRG